MDNLDIIEKAKLQALNHERLDKDTIISLLSIDPESEECEALGKAAFEVAQKVTGGKAYFWSSLGIDYKSCKMSCKHCSCL